MELKRERGTLTKEQVLWRDALIACGAKYFLWKPSMWEEVERVLTGG